MFAMGMLIFKTLWTNSEARPAPLTYADGVKVGTKLSLPGWDERQYIARAVNMSCCWCASVVTTRSRHL